MHIYVLKAKTGLGVRTLQYTVRTLRRHTGRRIRKACLRKGAKSAKKNKRTYIGRQQNATENRYYRYTVFRMQFICTVLYQV